MEAVYLSGFSGNYPSPYLTPDDLKTLSDRCLQGAKVICNIEAFEIDGEYDDLRPDLSFFGEDPAEKLKSWPERAARSASDIERLLADVAKKKNPIMFVVWLVWN